MKKTTTTTYEESKNYVAGRSYCYKLDRNLYMDLLHDAFVHWHKKSGGKNLFEEPIKRVIRVIKLTWFGYYVNPRSKERKFKSKSVEFKEHKPNTITPEDELIAKEFDKHMVDSFSSELQLEIYLLAVQGFRPFEIADIVDRGRPDIAYYFKKMRYTATLFN